MNPFEPFTPPPTKDDGVDDSLWLIIAALALALGLPYVYALFLYVKGLVS